MWTVGANSLEFNSFSNTSIHSTIFLNWTTLCFLFLKQDEAAQGPTKKEQATIHSEQPAKTQPHTSASDEYNKGKDERRIFAEKMLEEEDATTETQLPDFDEEISTDVRYITGDEGSLLEDDDDTFPPAYVPSFCDTSTTPGATSKALDDFAKDLLESNEQEAESGNKIVLPKQGKATFFINLLIIPSWL